VTLNDWDRLVAGVAVLLGASLDRLKLRVEALEGTPRVVVAVKEAKHISWKIENRRRRHSESFIAKRIRPIITVAPSARKKPGRIAGMPCGRICDAMTSTSKAIITRRATTKLAIYGCGPGMASDRQTESRHLVAISCGSRASLNDNVMPLRSGSGVAVMVMSFGSNGTERLGRRLFVS
jgi:hypothetical protein